MRICEALKKLYIFLFLEHGVGFCRFCYAMLIPCAISDVFCHYWMVFMTFVLVLVIQAKLKGWNILHKTEKEDTDGQN